MRLQVVIVGVILTAAMIAVPLFYNHRMNAGALTGGIVTFVGVPFLAGILQKQAHRAVALTASILLVFCPVVYAVTDPLAVQFEKLRDGYFLGTGATIIFVSTVWVAYFTSLRKWPAMFAAVAALLSAATAVCVMLWMFVYFE